MIENTSKGPSWTSPRRPTAREEPVRWNNWNGSAAEVIVVPTSEIA